MTHTDTSSLPSSQMLTESTRATFREWTRKQVSTSYEQNRGLSVVAVSSLKESNVSIETSDEGDNTDKVLEPQITNIKMLNSPTRATTDSQQFFGMGPPLSKPIKRKQVHVGNTSHSLPTPTSHHNQDKDVSTRNSKCPDNQGTSAAERMKDKTSAEKIGFSSHANNEVVNLITAGDFANTSVMLE